MLATARPLLAVREHCRNLDDVVTPEGDRRPWRWYDPELLGVLLPSFSPPQLDELFAPGQQIVMVTPTAWTWHALENGMLSSTERALLRAVVRLPSFRAVAHEAGALQHAEVLGYGGLRHARAGGQRVHRLLAVAHEALEERAARRVGEGMEDVGGRGGHV